MARKAASVEQLRLQYEEALLKAGNEESPLAGVLIPAALTEKALVTLLSNYFAKCQTAESILSEKGALGEFSKCADAAYCLGLISDGMLENLKLIGKIRNLFAHASEFIDFDHAEVKTWCSELTPFKGWVAPAVKAPEVGVGIPTKIHIKSLSPRKRFTWVCSGSCFDLIKKSAEVKHREKLKDTWSKPTQS